MTVREFGNAMGNPLARPRTGTSAASPIGDVTVSVNSLSDKYLEADGSLVSSLDFPLLPRAYAEVSGTVATGRTMPASNEWSAVCYGNGIFVAVAGRQSATNLAAWSVDGITWNLVSISALPGARWSSVCYGAGIFVAVSVASNSGAWSADGITWNSLTLPAVAGYSSIAYGNGMFVAIPSNAGTASTVAASSPDGLTWTARAMATSFIWYSVTYGKGLFVAVGTTNSGGSTNGYNTSTDGITWASSSRNLPSSQAWQTVGFGGGFFVALAYGSTVAARSADGISWIQTSLPSGGNWNSVAYGDGVFIAVAFINQSYAYSRDGLTWVLVSAGMLTSSYWKGIAFGAGTFVAVAGDPTTSSATISVAYSGTQSRLPSINLAYPYKAYVRVK